MSSSAALLKLNSKHNKQYIREAGAKVSTCSLFFTAWTAVALFGRDPQSWVTNDTMEISGIEHSLNSALSMDRIKRLTKRFGLTADQQVAIDRVVGQFQPLIMRLHSELGETHKHLASLRPQNRNFLEKTGRLSNDIGCLAAQLALTSRQMKTDVCAILTAEQNDSFGELQSAFGMYAQTGS